jgi:hypothetical protein
MARLHKKQPKSELERTLNSLIVSEKKDYKKKLKQGHWLRWLLRVIKRKELPLDFVSCAYLGHNIVGEVRKIGNAWLFKSLCCNGCSLGADQFARLRHKVTKEGHFDVTGLEPRCWLLKHLWFISIVPVQKGEGISFNQELIRGVSRELVEKALNPSTFPPASSKLKRTSSRIKKGISSYVKQFLETEKSR